MWEQEGPTCIQPSLAEKLQLCPLRLLVSTYLNHENSFPYVAVTDLPRGKVRNWLNRPQSICRLGIKLIHVMKELTIFLKGASVALFVKQSNRADTLAA
jgi:hypothetical protein